MSSGTKYKGKVFVCPSCNDATYLEEVLENCIVLSDIVRIEEEDYIIYGEQTTDYGEMSRIQCGACGARIADDYDDLIEQQNNYFFNGVNLIKKENENVKD